MDGTDRHRRLLVFFSAYDTLAGIAPGSLCEALESYRLHNKRCPGGRQGTGPVGGPFALSIIGTAGWGIAVGPWHWAARLQGAPGRSGYCLLGPCPARRHPSRSHAAFGCFFAGALSHELRMAAPPAQRDTHRVHRCAPCGSRGFCCCRAASPGLYPRFHSGIGRRRPPSGAARRVTQTTAKLDAYAQLGGAAASVRRARGGDN